MKKFLKMFKQTISDDNSVFSENQKDVTPQAEEPKSDSKEKNETAVATSNQCQNDTECVKHDKKLVTDPTEKEAQAVKGQSHSWRRRISNSNCRLFLGGFPDDVTEMEVKKTFEKYGKVVDVVIPLCKDTNKHKRYGFLEFLNEDSAKACLDDTFVSVNGKRVEVKKAWSRGTHEKREKSCDKETKEMGDREKFPSGSIDLDSMTERSVGSSCTGSESNTVDSQMFYQKLFENYFKAKFFLENLLNSETVNDTVSNDKVKKQHYDEKEVERVLSSLYLSNNDDSSEEEDIGDFASDSEESSIGGFENNFICDSVGRIRPNQTEATSLPEKNEERIACDLCKWAPLDNSDEGFLAHCRTFAHKQKLRERFKKKTTPDYSQNKALTTANEKAFAKRTRRRNKLTKQNPPNESSSKCQQNQNNKKNMKLIMEEIMSCVEAKTDKCIKCNVCNKTIPHTPDIRILMSNLTHHIQSKGHLAKIEMYIQKHENPQGKNMKGNTKLKTTPVDKTDKHSKNAQNNENSANVTKHPKSEFPNKTNNTAKVQHCERESASQLNTDKSSSSTKVKFRCLFCNYFCSQTQTFLTHLTSQFHSNKKKQTSLKTSSESLGYNLTNCLHCNTLLYGSLDIIKDHTTKCESQNKRL